MITYEDKLKRFEQHLNNRLLAAIVEVCEELEEHDPLSYLEDIMDIEIHHDDVDALQEAVGTRYWDEHILPALESLEFIK